MSSKETQKWVSGVHAGKRLACTPRQLPKLAAKGLITVRRIPGCAPRYLLADVDRLASQATQLAQSLASQVNGGPAEEMTRDDA